MRPPPEASTAPGHGAPHGAALRAGQVLAERYQVLEPARVDPFAGWYRAFDQELEVDVALRAVHPDLLPDEASRRKLIETLEPALGRGGRYLAPLLDADRDGARVFTVEPAAPGRSLRTLLSAREAEGRRFRVDEVLSLVARLGAALAALPAGLAHGDVRAENVTIATDGAVLLGGGMLVAGLSEGVVAATLQGHPDRALYAPERAQGVPSPTADLYGVGLIALEALSGALGPSPVDDISASLGGVGDALADLLSQAPSRRARSLDALIAALARQLDQSPPVLDVGAYWDGLTRHVHPLQGEPTDPNLRRPISSLAPAMPDATTAPHIELPQGLFEDDRPTDPPQDPRDLTRRVAYPFLDDSAEPLPGPPTERPIMASPEPTPEPVIESPRRIEGAALDGTQELSLDDYPELADDDPFEDEPTTTFVADDLLIPASEERSMELEPVTLAALKAIPRPRRLESIVPPMTDSPGLVLFDDSPAGPAASASSRAGDATTGHELDHSVLTLRPPAPEEEPARPARPGSRLVLMALAVGLAIVAASLLFVALQRSAAKEQREERLRERYEQLQGAAPAPDQGG